MQEAVAPAAPCRIFPVVGHSMSFLMEPGDQAVIEFCPAESLAPGDIAVLLRWGKKNSVSYTTHRVILNLPFRGRRLLLTKGDVNIVPDLPLFSSQAVGRVAGIFKRGTLYAPDTSFWFLKSLYSLCAYHLLWGALFLAAKLFALFCLITPAFLLCLKNSLYRRWEADLYPSLAGYLALPVYGGMKILAPLKIPPAAVKSGIINSDETWEGMITVQSYLQVAPGASVTVLPGTEIIFERGLDWTLPLLRGGNYGILNEMNSSHARIQVYGSFRALGSADKPVIFHGPSMGGVYALGSGELCLEHFRVLGGRMCAVGAADRAHLECRHGYFSACERGALLSGTASGFMTGCVFDGGKGPSLRCVDSSSLVISASEVFSATGNAVEISNEARASLSGLYVRGCARGVSVSGSARLQAKNCRFKKNKGPSAEISGRARCDFSGFTSAGAAGNALEILNEARVSLSGMSARGCSRGVWVAGSARLTAKDCRFEDNKGPSAEISGRARCDFSGFTSAGTPAGIVVRDMAGLCLASGTVRSAGQPALSASGSARLAISGVSFFSAGNAVYVCGNGMLDMADCGAVSEKGYAISLELSAVQLRRVSAAGAGGIFIKEARSAIMEDLQISARNYGIVSAADELEIRGLIVSGEAKGGLVLNRGRNNLADLSVRGCARGVWVSGSARLTAKDCNFRENACGMYVAGKAFSGLNSCRFEDNRGPSFEISAGARGSFSGCVFTGGKGPALRCRDNSSLDISATEVFAAAGSALEILNEARVNLSGMSARGCARGAWVAGSARLTAKDCNFRENACGMYVAGKAFAGLNSCRFEDNKGLSVEISAGARGIFSGCVFTGGKGPALKCVDNSVLVISASEVVAVAGDAVKLLDKARVSLSGMSVRGCARGVWVAGSARLTAKDCRFEDNKGPSAEILGRAGGGFYGCVFTGGKGPVLKCVDNSRLVISASGVFASAGNALEISNAARVSLSGISVRGCARGVWVAGSARLTAKDCRFEDNKGPSAEISGLASGNFSGFISVGVPAGIVVRGKSRLRLVSSSVRSAEQPALSVSGSARLSVSGTSFFSVGDAVFAGGRGILGMADSSAVSEKGFAINLGVSSAELRRVSASGVIGIFIRKVRLVKIENVRVNARKYAIVSSANNGRDAVVNAEAYAAPNPGLSGPASARGLYIKNVLFNGHPWTPPLKPGPRKRSLLFRFAAATYAMPVFSQLYRRVYLIGPAVARLLLPSAGMKSLYLYRGMTGSGWVPALSDMDLACLLRTLLPGEDWRLYCALKRRQRALKALLPYTGEIMAARDDEFLEFMSVWGIKGREFYSSSKLLYGTELPRRPSSGNGENADLTEAFYAYTILACHFFSAYQPIPFVRRNCLKNYMDVTRYLDTKSPLRDSRREYALAAGICLDDFASYPKKEAAFRAFSALHAAAMERLPEMARPATDRLADASASLNNSFAGPRPFEALAKEDASADSRRPGHTDFEKICRVLARTCGEEAGFVWDSLYRFYIIIPDALAGDRAVFNRVASAVIRAGRSSEFLAQASVLISAGAFELLSFTAYLNNPLFWLDLAGCCREGGGGEPNGGHNGGIYRYGFTPSYRRPSEDFTREMKALALKHFAATWRSLWEKMPLHYFYSRAAGLRLLLEKGNSPAFSDILTLSSVFQETYGPNIPGWKEFYSRGFGRENYEFIAVQVEAAREKNV